MIHITTWTVELYSFLTSIQQTKEKITYRDFKLLILETSHYLFYSKTFICMNFKSSYLNEISLILKKRRHKVIYSDDLKWVIKKVMTTEYTDKKAYKQIYYLKNKGYILSIKKDIFYCKLPEDHISEDLILEDRYRFILHHHCKKHTENKRYIWWLKALELWQQNFSIPEHIRIVNPKKQSKEVVVADKSIQFKKYSTKKIEHFKKFKKHTEKIKMWKYSFPFAKKELALLESLYNFDISCDRYTYELIKKIIKKTKHMDIKCIEDILKLGKHHTSVNRLYKICKSLNKKLADDLLPVIKKWSFVLDT